MTTPMQRTALTLPPFPVDAVFLANVATLQESGNGGAAALQGMALSPGKAIILPGVVGGTISAIVFTFDAGFQVVSITGTNSLFQLLGQMAASFLVPFANLPGRTSAWFALDTSLVIAAALPLLSPSIPTGFIGHSLGGAVAALSALYAASLGYNVQSVLTIGSPKVGDAQLASALSTLPYYRLEVQGDIVPSIPQALPMPLPGNILQVIPGDWALYRHGGTVSTLVADGTWQAGHYEIPPLELIATLLANAVDLHYAATYYAYGKAGFASNFNLAPFANGYEKPWLLIGLDEQPHLSGSTPIGSIPVPPYFTNQWVMKTRLSDGSILTTATLDDPPPPNWIPSLDPARSGEGGCIC